MNGVRLYIMQKRLSVIEEINRLAFYQALNEIRDSNS